LSGTYQFGFDPQCRNNDAACVAFEDELGNNDMVLEVESDFTDDCESDLFTVSFVGDLQFYEDAEFTTLQTAASDPYVIGQDTIYGKVTVDIPADPQGETYTFVGISIETVVVCTAADTLDVDANDGTGGCFSSSIDDDGPYYVIGSGANDAYQGETGDVSGNEATFSFLTFDTARTTIYVHVQLLLTMETAGTTRRRRMMLQTSSTGDAFRSYIGTAAVQDAETTEGPEGTDGAAALSVGFVPALFVFMAGIFV